MFRGAGITPLTSGSERSCPMFAAAFGSSLQAEYIYRIHLQNTSVTLTFLGPVVILLGRQSLNRSRKSTRPPRIRVPNHEHALFTVNNQKFVGVIQQLSLTGGSAILSKGPIPQGTLADMGLNPVFGKVRAQIQFLHRGADAIPRSPSISLH
jgi:hypothetical protein